MERNDMREYAGGNGTVRKTRGKWQGIVRYRDISAGDGGESVKGEWKTISKLFDIKSYPNNNRGKKAALEALAKWRNELIKAEPERAAREEAEKKAATEGMPLLVPEMSVSEYMGYYIDVKLAKKGREASTIRSYAYTRALVAKSRFGRMPLSDVRRGDVEQWRNDLLDRLSPVTVLHGLTLVKAVLEEACADELIPRNPASNVDAPAVKASTPNYLDPAARQALLAHIDGILASDAEDKARALAVKLALLTGMREGEVCALTWRDVDFGEGVIRVNAAIGCGSGQGRYYLKSTKTGTSRRAIPMPDELRNDLLARRDAMERKARGAGVDIGRAYVLGDVDGAFMLPCNLARGWKRMVNGLGLVGSQGVPPKFHDLRHTFATVMAHAGVPAVNLKQIMGHSSIDTTYRYYIGVDDDANRRAMKMTMVRMYSGTPIIDIARTGTEG